MKGLPVSIDFRLKAPVFYLYICSSRPHPSVLRHYPLSFFSTDLFPCGILSEAQCTTDNILLNFVSHWPHQLSLLYLPFRLPQCSRFRSARFWFSKSPFTKMFPVASLLLSFPAFRSRRFSPPLWFFSRCFRLNPLSGMFPLLRFLRNYFDYAGYLLSIRFSVSILCRAANRIFETLRQEFFPPAPFPLRSFNPLRVLNLFDFFLKLFWASAFGKSFFVSSLDFPNLLRVLWRFSSCLTIY